MNSVTDHPITKRDSLLYVVSSPSGGGKTSLVTALMKKTSVKRSISYTTRAQRPSEQHGHDYFFVDHDCFKQHIQNGFFIEYAEIFGHWYGTSRAWIETCLSQQQDVILEIDWQGAHAIRACFPKAIMIFLMPPSLHALQTRLTQRNEDESRHIRQRLDAASDDIKHLIYYDYIVMNQAFDQALSDLCAIVRSTQLSTRHQSADWTHAMVHFFHQTCQGGPHGSCHD